MPSSIGKVLVVDDDPHLTFILKIQLSAAGYEAHVAADGRQGWERVRELLPDLVVMDINLPEMDGVSVTRLIKTDDATRHIPVIILTGSQDSEHLIGALEAGAEEYVRKPFEVVELLARIRTVQRLANARKDLDRVNEELTKAVERKTRRLRILYEFTRALNAASCRDEILNLILNAAQEATDSERISLMLKADDEPFLKCVRAIGIDPQVVPRIRVRDVDGVAGRVFSSGKTFAAKAYGEGDAGSDRYHSEDFLSIPLVSTSLSTGGEIFGVLNVTEKSSNGAFTSEEIDCVRSIADAGAIALHNEGGRERLRNSVRILLHTVGRLAEYRDEETGDHLKRVSSFAGILAAELARFPAYADIVTPAYIEDLVQAAPMHDIGKVGIPDDILLKHGKLTDEEFAIMKTHTLIGRQTLELAQRETGSVPILQMCIDIAYSHHEKYDGTGYPRRIAGRDIPLSSRIIALVDAYDAITSRRPYKVARSHEDAVQTIQSAAGTHFDPDAVDAFLSCQDQFDAIRLKYNRSVERAPLHRVAS